MTSPDFSEFGLTPELPKYLSRGPIERGGAQALEDFVSNGGLAEATAELPEIPANWDLVNNSMRAFLGHHALGAVYLEIFTPEQRPSTNLVRWYLPGNRAILDGEYRLHDAGMIGFSVTDFSEERVGRRRLDFTRGNPHQFVDMSGAPALNQAFDHDDQELRERYRVSPGDIVVAENILDDIEEDSPSYNMLTPNWYTPGAVRWSILDTSSLEQQSYSAGEVMFTNQRTAYRPTIPSGQLAARLMLAVDSVGPLSQNTVYLSQKAVEQKRPGALVEATREEKEGAQAHLLPIVESGYPGKQPGSEVPLDELDKALKEEAEEAIRASEDAFPENKNTKVGGLLVVKTASGVERKYSGANLKKSSFNITHAEEDALNAAIKASARDKDKIEKLERIFLYINQGRTSPCGNCREMFKDFDPEGKLVYYLISPDRQTVRRTTQKALLPLEWRK